MLLKPVFILQIFILFAHEAASNDNKPVNEFSYTTTTQDQIEIKGTHRFVTRVVSCLDLIKTNDLESYEFINKYIGVIKQHPTSGMDAAADPPTFEMSTKTAFYSLTWCASSIAHDAYHSYLYQKHRPKLGSKSQHKMWMGARAEGKSIHFQRRVSQRIGAPPEELNYLLNLKGTHSDLDGDGRFTQKDYEKRDW